MFLQVAGYLAPFLAPLFGNLVADAPHHDGGVVAVGAHEVLDIAVAPLLEEPRIAVLALRIDPHIETLGHHHHTHRVADIHLHLTRHIVRRADGVAAHLLHRLDLAYQGGLVDGSTQGTQVVVQTDTLDLTVTPLSWKPPSLVTLMVRIPIFWETSSNSLPFFIDLVYVPV